MNKLEKGKKPKGPWGRKTLKTINRKIEK